MRRIFIYLFLIYNFSTISFGQEIYRLIDPLTSSGSKSPYDGPPFARLGSAQFYYNTNWVYTSGGENYNPDVDAAFAQWNSAGTVQFSRTTSQTALWCVGFYDQDGQPYPQPGGTSVNIDPTNFSIIPNQSQIALNTVYNWKPRVQDLINLKMDVQTVIGHEIGHIHGLAHPYPSSYTHDATAPLMAGGDNEYFWNHTARSLRTQDINGTRFLQYHIWVPEQSPTLQDAFNNSYTGANIIVSGGTHTLTSNNVITSGGSLSLSPNTTIIFASGKKLSVYGGGTLTANGVTFRGNGTAGNWNSIYFYANSNGSVQNSTIKDAQAGIYTTTNANVTVSGCTITNNSLYGLSVLQNSNVTVSNCTISNNGTGINTTSSIINIAGNDILNNINYGINANNISNSFYWHDNTLQGNGYAMLLNNASPYIHNNFISDNAHGIVITSSSPNFANPSNQWRGYNAITCASTPLFKAENYSTVYMGYGYDGGFNSIFGSDLPDMQSLNHSGIYADNNYWASPNPQIYADGTSWILARTPLSSDPNPGSGCSGFLASSSSGISPYSPFNEGEIAAQYWEAIDNGRKGNVQKAKDLLQIIIEGNFDEKYSPLALLTLYEFSANDKVGLNDLLANINNRAKDDLLRPFAIRLLAREAALTNNNKDMVFYNTELINNYPNSINELAALYDLVVYYSETEQDLAKANSYFSRLKEAYSDEDLTLFAGINLGINLGDLKKETSTEKVPETFYLGDAFPNPFNPTTQIKYNLSKDEFVTVKVYDILGKEVALLVNEQKSAGTYLISFDASNLSSGIYFYSISAGKFNQVKKMMLLR